MIAPAVIGYSVANLNYHYHYGINNSPFEGPYSIFIISIFTYLLLKVWATLYCCFWKIK